MSRRFEPLGLQPLTARPLVSILVPNYNYSAFIERAIASAVAQSYQHLEVLVCDDGSTDDSPAIVERLAHADSRVRLFRKSNGGAASALNVAYHHARGDVVCLLDADDLYDREKVERVVERFIANPDAGCCVHRLRQVDGAGATIGAPTPVRLDRGWIAPEALMLGGHASLPPSSGLCFRRELCERLFPIPDHLKRVADGWLVTGALFLTKLAAIDEPLASYRRHGANVFGASRPTLQTVRRIIDDVPPLIDELHALLAREYGDAVAARLRAEDNPGLCEQYLAAHVLGRVEGQGRPRDEVRTMLRNVRPRRRLIWRVILLAPSSLGAALFSLWWGSSPLKRRLQELARATRSIRAGAAA